MSRSIWVAGTEDTLGTATRYIPLFGPRAAQNAVGGQLAWYRTIIPIADGTICYDDGVFRVSLDAAPGVGNSRTFTVGGTGGDSDIVVVISGTATTGQDAAHFMDVAGGSYAYLKCESSGTPAAARVRYTLTFDGTVAGQSALCGVGDTGGVHNEQDRYFCFSGAQYWGGIPATDGGSVMLVLPCPGDVKRLFVELSVAPGRHFDPISGRFKNHRRDFTVYDQDGATVLTCIITGLNTTCNDTTHTFTVAEDDYIYLKCHPVQVDGQWPDTARLSASVVFEADTPEQFIIPSQSDELPLSGGRWRQACVGVGTLTATEAHVHCLAQAMKVTRLQVRMSGSPTTQHQFTFMRNAANTELDCTITGANTSCFATGNVIPANDDLIDVRVVATATATKRFGAVSLCAEPYTPPSGTPLMMALF